MRIAFCGHSHHRTTASSGFMLDALGELGTIEQHWVEDWAGRASFDAAPLLSGRHDAVVVWQMESVALRLAGAGLSNVTFFPMYDSCHAYPDSFWRRLASIKVVSFSSSLHARLQRLGVRVRFARYWPAVPDERAGDGPELAGFFWQRQQDLTWATIRRLLGDAPFDRFTLHDALDPSHGHLVPPGPEDVARFRIRSTRWFPTPAEARADLRSHNVYFAPRLREGIGMSFLEAMAMGFLVVAPDRPTMNEYIVSGVNGLLYDPDLPEPLDFTRHQEMGRRARQVVEEGHEQWRRSVPAVLELVATPTRNVPVQAPLGALDPLSFDARGGSPGSPLPPARSGPVRPASAEAPRPMPLVSVVLGPGGIAAGASATLRSVAAQDWPRLEVVGPERGKALGEALSAAAGEYVVFLAPGEAFSTRDALSRALRGAPGGADLIVGAHLLRDEHGNEELRPAADPARAYSALRRGEIGWGWIEALPAPGAVLWRTEVLRRTGFRALPDRLVHQDALLRAIREGARVHHALAQLAVCPCRRRSIRERLRTAEAWRTLALEHTDRPEVLERMVERMRSEARGRDLHRLPGPDLLLSIGRVPGAFRELKRRVRTRRALARPPRAGSSR